MLKNLGLILFAFFALALPMQAKAECECRCVGGIVKPVCSSPTEQRPRCTQHMCPVARPAMESIQAPDKPVECSERQIHNPFTGLDEMKTVCQ